MIAPPPHDNSTTDQNALGPEGSQKYLESLKNRLDRLEGRKGNLTSKDMLSAMAEVKDDHLRQVNNTETPLYVNEMDLDDTSRTTWCCHCFSRSRYARGNADSVEEYVCLVNCDELEHNHEDNITTEDHNQTNTDTSISAFHAFEDDFVK